MTPFQRLLALLFAMLAASFAAAEESLHLADDCSAAATLEAGGPITCSCACDDCDSCCGWYGFVEALGWSRDNRTSRVAVVRVTDEGNALPGTVVLTTGDPDFELQPGVRAVVGWRRDEFRACELSYFGIFNWQSSASAAGANDLAIPRDLGLASLDFFAADRMTLGYKSRLHNAEATLVEAFSAEWSLLAGLRYLHLDESLDLRSTDFDTSTSQYSIHATNHLFGCQAGARYNCYWERFGWDATAKAGIYGNAARQAQFVTDFPQPFLIRDRRSSSGGQVAFVGDVNISGLCFLNDAWAIRAGYNLLWVQGVAMAPDQLDFTDTPASGTALHSGGGLFAHGVSVGVQATW